MCTRGTFIFSLFLFTKNATHYREEGHHVPIALVANKTDLIGRRPQEVDRETGVNTADAWRCRYFEASARTRKGVEDSFHGLISTLMNYKKK